MNNNLSFEFLRMEIQRFSVRIFGFGAEGKGGNAPLPRRKTENSPEELEDTMDKPKTQVNNAAYDPHFVVTL